MDAGSLGLALTFTLAFDLDFFLDVVVTDPGTHSPSAGVPMDIPVATLTDTVF